MSAAQHSRSAAALRVVMVLCSGASASFACVAPANLSLPAPGDDASSSVGDDSATTPDSPDQEAGSDQADARDGAPPDGPSSDGAGSDARDEASTFVCPGLVDVGFGTEGCPCTSWQAIACPGSGSAEFLVCTAGAPTVGSVYRGQKYVWQDGGTCPTGLVCDPQHPFQGYQCMTPPVTGDDASAPDGTVEGIDAGSPFGSSSGGPGGPGGPADASSGFGPPDTGTTGGGPPWDSGSPTGPPDPADAPTISEDAGQPG